MVMVGGVKAKAKDICLFMLGKGCHALPCQANKNNTKIIE